MKAAAFLPLVQTSLTRPRHTLGVSHTAGDANRSQNRPPVVASLAFDNSTITSFTEQIKGEWTGYEGNFSPETGKALPVPDYYVPEEFSEWGLRPLGFESNHSITVRSDKLYRKFFRVLPSVSLFADHVDAEEDFRCDTIGDGLTVYYDGSFVNGKKALPTKRSKLERAPRIEFRLSHPYEEKQAANVTLNVDFESACIVQEIRAVVEKWSCVYCDGADMDGSSGYIEGWVNGATGNPHELTGRWLRGDALFEREEGTQREGGAVFLPEGIDVAFEERPDGGRTARAAWRIRDRRVALQRIFDAEGNLVNTERFVEHRQ
ncbi:unnamed protein product [Agarophyton chilense]